ncbi:MAG: hypothetical protein M9897_06390 [Brumimicrobium sp.]|nr:hypothetical protein [Brumimicrobium sp.]
MKEKKSFFMVFLEGERTPAYKHPNLASAELEAQRLAKIHMKKAYVLCSIKSFELQMFKTEDCRPDSYDIDGLPF